MYLENADRGREKSFIGEIQEVFTLGYILSFLAVSIHYEYV